MSTCDSCKWARKIALPQERRVQLLCYYNPPMGFPVIGYQQTEDGLIPKPMGLASMRPEVQPMDHCAHHTPTIALASVVPIK